MYSWSPLLSGTQVVQFKYTKRKSVTQKTSLHFQYKKELVSKQKQISFITWQCYMIPALCKLKKEDLTNNITVNKMLYDNKQHVLFAKLSQKSKLKLQLLAEMVIIS